MNDLVRIEKESYYNSVIRIINNIGIDFPANGKKVHRVYRIIDVEWDSLLQNQCIFDDSGEKEILLDLFKSKHIAVEDFLEMANLSYSEKLLEKIRERKKAND